MIICLWRVDFNIVFVDVSLFGKWIKNFDFWIDLSTLVDLNVLMKCNSFRLIDGGYGVLELKCESGNMFWLIV